MKQAENSKDAPSLISRANPLKHKTELKHRGEHKVGEIIKYFGREKENVLVCFFLLLLLFYFIISLFFLLVVRFFILLLVL